ncbi:MAG: hypothetical protein ACK44B_02605 [Flavobacteriales bacterium]
MKQKGLTPVQCDSEDAARSFFEHPFNSSTWPCYFPVSDTTGEKAFEEFYTEDEELDLNSYLNLGIIKNDLAFDSEKLDHFSSEINRLRESGIWSKEEIVSLFLDLIPTFDHEERGKYLDSKM